MSITDDDIRGESIHQPFLLRECSKGIVVHCEAGDESPSSSISSSYSRGSYPPELGGGVGFLLNFISSCCCGLGLLWVLSYIPHSAY